MSYTEINIYNNQNDANVKQAAEQAAGRTATVVQTNSVSVNDVAGSNVLLKNGNPDVWVLTIEG